MAALLQLPISYNFRHTTSLIDVQFLPTTKDTPYIHIGNDDGYKAFIPTSYDFNTVATQNICNQMLMAILRDRAQRVLPHRVAQLAESYGLTYHHIYIKNIRTRWGSCSSLRNLNFSLWLLMAPEHLVDYVIKHELAHLHELNHSDLFWKELDRFCGGPGKARALENEMKQFSLDLLHRK